MNRAEAAKLRAAKLKAKDPEYFAKLAAKGKGKPAPNRARSREQIIEAAAKGGRSRGMGKTYQKRVQRSIELERKIEEDRLRAIQHRKVLREKRAKDKQRIETKRIMEGWNEDEVSVDKWA